jgi:hypothetical protein
MIDSLLGQIKYLLKLFLVILYYLTKPHKQLNTQYTNISTTHSLITYMQEALGFKTSTWIQAQL